MAERNAGTLLLRALRRFQAQKMLKKLSKMRRQKEMIAQEILSTERIYVANLQVLAGVSVLSEQCHCTI